MRQMILQQPFVNMTIWRQITAILNIYNLESRLYILKNIEKLECFHLKTAIQTSKYHSIFMVL